MSTAVLVMASPGLLNKRSYEATELHDNACPGNPGKSELATQSQPNRNISHVIEETVRDDAGINTCQSSPLSYVACPLPEQASINPTTHASATPVDAPKKRKLNVANQEVARIEKVFKEREKEDAKAMKDEEKRLKAEEKKTKDEEKEEKRRVKEAEKAAKDEEKRKKNEQKEAEKRAREEEQAKKAKVITPLSRL